MNRLNSFLMHSFILMLLLAPMVAASEEKCVDVEGKIEQLNFSDDGKFIYYFSGDETNPYALRKYDIANETKEQLLGAYSGRVNILANGWAIYDNKAVLDLDNNKSYPGFGGYWAFTRMLSIDAGRVIFRVRDGKGVGIRSLDGLSEEEHRFDELVYRTRLVGDQAYVVSKSNLTKINLSTREKESIEIPGFYWEADWSADGKRLLTLSAENNYSEPMAHFYDTEKMELIGSIPLKGVTGDQGFYIQMAPDGKSFMLFDHHSDYFHMDLKGKILDEINIDLPLDASGYGRMIRSNDGSLAVYNYYLKRFCFF